MGNIGRSNGTTKRTPAKKGARSRLRAWVIGSLLALLASVVACTAAPARTPLAAPVTSVATTSAPAPVPPLATAPAIPSEEIASVPVSARDPQWGQHDAPVTLVAFEDFQCPFCARAEATLKQLRDSYGPKQLRMVWKNNPLPFHHDARPTAEAAMAVFGLNGNDAFWSFHDRAFSNQTTLNDASFRSWAKDVGVDPEKFDSALATRRFSGKIEQDIDLAAKLGANGTPAFRINGVSVSGAQPFERFKAVIDAQLIEATKATIDGTPASEVYAALTNKQLTIEPREKPARPEEEDTSVWKVPVLADDPVRGRSDALVTVVVFADFQCPFCKRVQVTLKQLADNYGDDLRFVWKDNPLPFHPLAKPAAALARFVYAHKGNLAFWEVHDQLFASNPKLADEDLKRIAETAGVSWDAAKAAIEHETFTPRLEASMELAADLRANGTPHFFVNGVRLSGAQPLANFTLLVDAELAKAKATVAHGVPRAKVYAEIMKGGREPPPPARKEVPTADASSPMRGNSSAPVVIQEFADFQCPFCKRVQLTLGALEKQYGNKLKIVWRNLPLPFHQNAPLAAEAALEVFAQKGNAGFWEFHDKLYAGDGDDITRTSRENLEQIARGMAIDMTRFKEALDTSKHASQIDADSALANRVGIDGTPAFVINGYYVSGAQPAAAFKKIINLVLNHGRGAAGQPRVANAKPGTLLP